MGKQIKSKFYISLYDGQKVPRKIKKALLDIKLSRGELRKKLKQVKVIEPSYNMYDRPDIEPHMFCPHCGETGYTRIGNMTSYPEHWEYFNCLRCRQKVAYIDNSPFIHILEYVDNGLLPKDF